MYLKNEELFHFSSLMISCLVNEYFIDRRKYGKTSDLIPCNWQGISARNQTAVINLTLPFVRP